MISYFSALSFIYSSVSKSVFLKRFCFSDLNSSITNTLFFDFFSFKKIPSYATSAMDGYAFNVFKIRYNFDYIDNRFFILDIFKAGDFKKSADFDGDYVIEIMTGAKVPSFFNSVVKIEDIYFDFINPFEILFKKYIFLGENVRQVSDDFKFGTTIFHKGDNVSLSNINILSTFCFKNFYTLKSLKIFLFCTGNEVLDDFQFSFKDSLIYNSFKDYLFIFFKYLNLEVVYCGVVLDNKTFLKNKFINLFNSNDSSLIITTGSVSKGKADFVPLVLSELGVDIIFHKVAIKPGKPILFANYNNAHYIFCLPGNPISSIVGVRFFIYPFIRYVNGLFFESPFLAILAHNYTSIVTIDSFLKSFVYFYNSSFYVLILKDQQSFKVSSIADSNSFVFLRSSFSYKDGDLIMTFFNNPYFYW